jgi:hypothetical protein
MSILVCFSFPLIFGSRLEFRVSLGANPSSEEQDEALEEGATQVNNVVHSFRLQSTTFDKKSFLTYLKGFYTRLSGRSIW